MPNFVYELIILAILALFALWGMRRGLILSLFSLVAVLVSFVGGILLANLWAPSVAGWLHPTLQPTVSAAVQAALAAERDNGEAPLEEVLDLLEQAELPLGLDKFVADLREDGMSAFASGPLAESLASALAEKAASAIAHVGLFLLSFLMILILWYFLGHALDLVARLPGLHALNMVGGGVLGVLRGAVILFVLAWVVRFLWSGLIPDEAVEQTTLLRFFMTAEPMDWLG